MSSWLKSIDTGKLAGKLSTIASQVQSLAENALKDDDLAQETEQGSGWYVDEDDGLGEHPVDPITRSNDSGDHERGRHDQHGTEKIVSDLEKDNHRLKNEILRITNDYDHELAERDQRINSLETALEEAKTSKSSPTSDDDRVQTLQEKLNKAVLYIKRLNEENGQLNSKITELESKSSHEHDSPQILELQSLEAKIHDLELQLEGKLDIERNNQSVHLETQLQNLQSKYDALVSEETRLVSDNETLRTEIEQFQQESEKMNEALISNRERQKELELEMKEKVDKLNTYILELQAQNDQVTSVSKISDVNEDANLGSELEVARAELDVLQRNLEDIKSQLIEKTDFTTQLERDLQFITEERDNLAQELSQLSAADTSRVVALEERNASLLNEIETLNAKLQSLTFDLESSSEREQDAKQAITDLTRQLRDANQSLQSSTSDSQMGVLTSQLEELQASSRAREQELQAQIAKIKQAAAEKIKRLMSELQSARSSTTATPASLPDSQSHQDIQSTQILSQRVSDLESEVQDRVQELEKVTSYLEESRSLCKEYEAQVSDLEAHVKSLTTELEGARSSLTSERDALQDRLAIQEKEFIDLQQSLKQHQETQNTTSALQTELMSLKKLLASREAELKAKQGLEAQVQDLQEEIQKLNETLDESDMNSQMMLEDISKKHKSELASYLKDKDRLKELQDELLASQHHVQKLTDELDVTRKEQGNALSSAHVALEAECDELRKQVQQKKEEMLRLETNLSTLESRIEELLDLNKSLQGEKTYLLDEMAQLQVSGPETHSNDMTAVVQVLDKFTSAAGLDTQALETISSVELRERLLSLSAFIQQVQESIGNDSHVREEFLAKEASFETEKTQLIEQLESLRLEHSESIAERGRLQDALDQHQSMVKQLSEEVQSLHDERNTILDKLTSMKNVIGPKLQAEMAEAERLRVALEEKSSENDELRNQLQELVRQVDHLRSQTSLESTESSRLEIELDTARDQVDKLNEELHRLRQHLVEAEETHTEDALRLEEMVSELQRQVQALEHERDEWAGANELERQSAQEAVEKMEQLKNETLESQAQMNTLRDKLEIQTMATLNLQNVLEQFEKSKESDIQAAVKDLQMKLHQLTTSCKSFESRALEAEAKMRNMSELAETSASSKKELEEKNILVSKLRHDVIQLQTLLSEAMRRMRNGNGEESVDRKLVSNLLVSFISAPRGDGKRYEMLGLISNVLKFSEDDKVKVGLARPAQGSSPSKPRSSFVGILPGTSGNNSQQRSGQAEQSPAADSSFMDMWISFLLKETANPESGVEAGNAETGTISPEASTTSSLQPPA